MSTLKTKLPRIKELRVTQCLLKTYAKIIISYVPTLTDLKVLYLYFFDFCDAIGLLSKVTKLHNLEEVVIIYTDGRLCSLRNFETVKQRWIDISKGFINRNKKLNYFELGPDSNTTETVTIKFKLSLQF